MFRFISRIVVNAIFLCRVFPLTFHSNPDGKHYDYEVFVACSPDFYGGIHPLNSSNCDPVLGGIIREKFQLHSTLVGIHWRVHNDGKIFIRTFKLL